MRNHEESPSSDMRFFFNPDILVNRINCMMRLALVINELPPEAEHTEILKVALTEILDSIQVEELVEKMKRRHEDDDDGTRH